MKLLVLLTAAALALAAPLETGVAPFEQRNATGVAPLEQRATYNCHFLYGGTGWRTCTNYDPKCPIGGNFNNKAWDTLEIECLARGDAQWCDRAWAKTPDNKYIPEIFFENVCIAGVPACPGNHLKRQDNTKPNHHDCRQ